MHIHQHSCTYRDKDSVDDIASNEEMIAEMSVYIFTESQRRGKCKRAIHNPCGASCVACRDGHGSRSPSILRVLSLTPLQNCRMISSTLSNGDCMRCDADAHRNTRERIKVSGLSEDTLNKTRCVVVVVCVCVCVWRGQVDVVSVRGRKNGRGEQSDPN